MKIVGINRKRLSKSLRVCGSILLYAGVYIAITMAFAELQLVHLDMSDNMFELKKNGDYILLGLLVVSILVGLVIFRWFLKRDKYSKLSLWSGNIGLFVLGNALLTILLQAIASIFGKLTLDNMRTMIWLVDSSYYMAYVFIIVMAAIILFTNSQKGYLKHNNWVAFITLCPYIIEAAFCARYQMMWNNFKTLKSFNYSTVYKMFKAYNRAGNHASLLTMDDLTKVFGFAALFGVTVLVYIGGEYLVYISQKKIKERRQSKAA